MGILSDTHGHLPDRVLEVFGDVDAIVHAGDVVGGGVLDALRSLGVPVHAVRGNCDDAGEEALLPALLNVRIGGARFLVTHKRHDVPRTLPPDVRVVITGHTHRLESVEEEGVLRLNPGSAGDPHAGDPATVAIVEVSGGEVRVETTEL